MVIRAGVIYVEVALALFAWGGIPTPVVIRSALGALAFAVPLGALVLRVELRHDRSFLMILLGSTGLRAVLSGLATTGALVVLRVQLPQPEVAVAITVISAVAIASAFNPLLGWLTLPPQPVAEPEGKEVVEQRHRLADMALQQPQVQNAGLSEDEKKQLRAEIEAEVEREAADIARATSLPHAQFVRAKRAYIGLEPIAVFLAPWLKWLIFYCAGVSGLMLLTVRVPGAHLVTPIAAVVLPALTVGATAAPGSLRWSAGVRSAAPILLAASAAAATVALLLPADTRWPSSSAAFAVLSAVALVGRLVVGPLLKRDRWLRSNDPAAWPRDTDRQHDEAVRSHDEWLRAMFEVAVLRIVSAKIGKYVQRSYGTDLPPASVEKLGDITELTQFVPTETSARLGRVMTSMPSAAIGLSGPRGVGKSTVLRVLSELRANPSDLGLIVPAPTSYDAREFLTHLFARLCEVVLPHQPPPKIGIMRRINWPGMMVLLGLATGAITFFWAPVVEAATWAGAHVLGLVFVFGMFTALAGFVWWGAERPTLRDSPIEEMARGHLRTLRYLETQTVTRTGSAKTPLGDLGASKARQRAEILKTYPELVDDFRTFLEQVGLSLRSKDARVVICIDELDKIGTPEQAEKFLNDIKAIFRVRHSYFLVSVSEDALTSFSRRALAVRTTFDTAFDAVVEVDRFSLADTRALLVQQVIRLPEPFVWFCHCLSGGLPRDLGRIVRALYDERNAHEVTALPLLAAELVRQDVRAVAQGQLAQASGRADAGEVLGWIADAADLPMTSAALTDHCGKAPDVEDDLGLLVAQCCAHLHYAAAVLDVFSERLGEWVELLRNDDAPLKQLAKARSLLSVDPGLARRAVDQVTPFW